MMDCHELEDRLEALLDGELGDEERRSCREHAASCPRCRELLPLLASAAEPPAELIGAVMAATSGPACGRSQERLAAWLDAELAGDDHRLLSEHLDGCSECGALARAMTRLAAELPLLAELEPDPGFTAAVLARTLPVRVRLRRWWVTVWPQWVRRPRFASEAAFIATMVLVLVFATPGSPLAAVPGKALKLARGAPEARLELPIGALEARLTHLEAPLAARLARGREWAHAGWETASVHGRAVAAGLESWLGTWRRTAASLWGSADSEASGGEDAAANPDEETP